MNLTKNNCPTIAVLYLFLSIAITLLMAQTPFSKSAQAADYEGFGAVTRGALDAPGGYETYHVTSLANSGDGTLRDAVSGNSQLNKTTSDIIKNSEIYAESLEKSSE